MGKKKYITRIEELFNKSPVVSFNSIEKIIRNKKNVKQYAKQFVRNQLAKGRIKRLAKGYYSKHDDIGLTVFCFKPAYFGLQDALSVHNLWEQEAIPIILTLRKVRQGIRQILGLNVMIRRIDKKYFFGFEYMKNGDFYFPYSDIEKTFIDMVYFREYLSEETLEDFREKIDLKKLKNYLARYPKRFRKMVLGKIGRARRKLGKLRD